MERDGKVELLAPAGNREGFYGAVGAGADAVYLGGSRFGARAYAENFTTEEVVECIKYAHLMGVKVYLTVNTLVKETELQDLEDYLAPFHEAGLDAVIVQDLGVLVRIRRLFPGLALHASTQMSLCSAYGARLLKDLDVSRIVPARELCLEELEALKQSTGLELETFIHGAMCYCYSGQCLFSSILGGRSGNRGRCAQPCRLPYTVRGTGGAMAGQETYPLSLKDMCTIGHIPALIQGGIDSFKIEGRMKKPEYAAGVTAIYRRYIDSYYALQKEKGAKAAAAGYVVSDADLQVLSSLYIRSGLQEGYYFQRNGRDMVTLDSPAYSGGQEAMRKEIREKYLTDQVRLPLSVEAVFCTGQTAMVSLDHRGHQVSVQGQMVVPAKKQPITRENVEKQLGKLGDSAFYVEQMKVQVSEDAFYPLKQINELRRSAVAELERVIRKAAVNSAHQENMAREPGDRQGSNGDRENVHGHIQPASREPGWAISVCTLEQFHTLCESLPLYREIPLRRVYVDGDLLVEWTSETIALCRSLPEEVLCMAVLPYIVRKQEEEYLDQLCRILVENSHVLQGCMGRSLDGLGFLQEYRRAGRGDFLVRTDANVYCWNSQAAALLENWTDGFCLPYELNSRERQFLTRMECAWGKAGNAWERIVYGRIPMMVTANCLRKTMGDCLKEGGTGKGLLTLQDRYQKEFPVAYHCRHCMNVIYNSVPLVLKDSWPGKQRDGADLRMDFTVEKSAEMRRVLDFFLKERGTGTFPGPYTTGHERRGVE